MKKFLEEFKAFALRGNVMDMAVGVLIGGAFSGIVTSLTDNFIQPIIKLVMTGKVYTLEEISGYASTPVSTARRRWAEPTLRKWKCWMCQIMCCPTSTLKPTGGTCGSTTAAILPPAAMCSITAAALWSGITGWRIFPWSTASSPIPS